MTHLILNQYRQGSGYKDVIGRLYHFPKRYLNSFAELPSLFVYYEPREGGDQVYFGTGTILSVYEDTEDAGNMYAELWRYEAFTKPVGFYSAPDRTTWEAAETMRNSVRRVSAEQFREILTAGGVEYRLPEGGVPVPESLARELRSYPGPGRRPPAVLRRIRRILEEYERPSGVTNEVKRTRGDACQLCGIAGFVKRDGRRYCEVHHLFHLSHDPPVETLAPEHLVVLCATCHRRLHYATVSIPIATDDGWKVTVDETEVRFKTKPS